LKILQLFGLPWLPSQPFLKRSAIIIWRNATAVT
jgi:hypothetical protein